MPIYQYACPKCSKQTEVIKSASQYDRAEFCEDCSAQLERVMARTAPPQFKGTGFYQTDYKRKGR